MDSPASKKSRLLLENSIRVDLCDNEIINDIKSSWTSSDIFSKNGVEIIHHPFTVCMVRNFANNPELLNLAAEELKDVTFHQKSNDLYEFKQSDDVRNLTNFTFIPQLYDFMRLEGRKWVNNVTGGNKLKEDISATFSSYGYQDRLLCHDDKCEDRHIAFILYLTENWNEDDGGCLELFNTDSYGYPSEIVKTICPKFNSMIFFEVTHNSFHQVSEIKSKTKNRLSINGWFHSSGKKLENSNCKILELPQTLPNDKQFNLQQYFLFIYFGGLSEMDIKSTFVFQSEIQLDKFIESNFLEEIQRDLKSKDLKWVSKGPANIRKYEVADTSTLLPSLKLLKEIFESKCWFQYLQSITALNFVPFETSDLTIWQQGILPVCNFEIQKWTNSCYTLIHDKDPEFHSKALDVVIRIPFEKEEESQEDSEGSGEQEEDKDEPETGHIIYIDKASEDEECLLHIGYKMNSLGLIYRDKKTLRFTKYLDSTCKPFYQVLCTYRPWKPPLDQPNLKHCKEEETDESDASDNDC